MQQEIKDMDIYFKDGVISCKYCKKSKKFKWPMTLADLVSKEMQQFHSEFVQEHTVCKAKQN